MKNLALFLVLLAGFAFGQSAVKSYPIWHQSVQVYSDTVMATTVTTNTLACKEWNGTVTLFFDLDSLAGSSNYGDLTVQYELYDSRSAKWYHYYSDANTLTDLVTIGNAKVGSDVYCRMNDVTSWSVADSVRWSLTQASADTLIVDLRVAGQ